MDRNGVMTFLSRSDRSITRFDGYKIKPYEVENIIKAYAGVPTREEQVALVEKIVQEQFINNADVSARQIPAWFRFRESLPLTVNSKVNYNALANEPLSGNEIAVYIEETNISIDKIVVK